MKKRTTLLALLVLPLLTGGAFARDYHVSPSGDDAQDGSAARPFKTISAAARAAQPGDVITVHQGVYRERVTPPRGGTSDAKRIVYQADPGEEVVIKGSEVVRDWKPVKDGVWKAELPNSFFGEYNPYQDPIKGDWFTDRGRPHHTGEVYLSGKSLYEVPTLEGVLNPKPLAGAADQEGSTWTWYCESNATSTTIYANFHGRDPNKELVEINVREACFYPDQPGRDYITVRGFRMCHAATQWAAPTAEQIGLVGTHWSKGWIIENNVISDSKCSGITLGKDRKSGHNVWTNDPSKDGATHYNEVIVRALKDGWAKKKIGSHIVRNNTISHCEQTGICGSLGAAFSRITGNNIHDVWTKRQFAGAEIAGIKIHASIDMLIANNRLCNVGRGMWMDWMAQGTRITGNLCTGNITDDLFSEVNHGPYLVDNNIFLSAISLNDMSQGGAYVHNLMAGQILWRPEPKRSTPYHRAHATKLAGLRNIGGGDNRFFNNIFVGTGAGEPPQAKPGRSAGHGLGVYEKTEFPIQAAGNVYFKGARPGAQEKDAVVLDGHDPLLKIEEKQHGTFLTLNLGTKLESAECKLMTTALLGKAVVPGLRFENPNGSKLKIDTDYFGRTRDSAEPIPGPFEDLHKDRVTLKVW